MQPTTPLETGYLDRAGAVRTDDAVLARLWERDDACRIAVQDGQVGVLPGSGPEDILLDADSASTPPGRRVLLGVDADQRPWWLLMGQPDGRELAWIGMREIGPQLAGIRLEAVMTAVAMESWHARHGFCPICGQPTTPGQAGWVRRCTSDGTEHYPRTDPAIIVVVIDGDDRALLGRQTRWPDAWRSALAGFVEPGERAEAAVHREVAEEVGVRLSRVQYLASQPWPFPGSLMLGFHAWTDDPTVQVDGVEIAEAGFFTRAELAAAASSGRIQLPPGISIARRLIEQWYGSAIPGNWMRP